MYQVKNPINNAFQGMNQAAGTFGSMTKDIGPEKPKPTAGGAIINGVGGAMMGSQIAGMTGATAASGVAGSAGYTAATTGALGLGLGAATGVGAVVGLGAYLLS